MSNPHMDKIEEFTAEQKGKCFICDNKIGKPYLDVDYDQGLAFAVNCFDCYTVLSGSNYDISYLKKVIKYLKFREKIYLMNQEEESPEA